MKDANENQNGVTGVDHTTGSLRLHCHRCGWEGEESELDENEQGVSCPKCPDSRDIHASLSIIENVECDRTSQEV